MLVFVFAVKLLKPLFKVRLKPVFQLRIEGRLNIKPSPRGISAAIVAPGPAIGLNPPRSDPVVAPFTTNRHDHVREFAKGHGLLAHPTREPHDSAWVVLHDSPSDPPFQRPRAN